MMKGLDTGQPWHKRAIKEKLKLNMLARAYLDTADYSPWSTILDIDDIAQYDKYISDIRRQEAPNRRRK